MNKFFKLLMVLFAGLFITSTTLQANPLTITWEDLEPKQGAGAEQKFAEENTRGLPGVKEFGGDKGELELFLKDLKFMKDTQPKGNMINKELHGKEVRIAGYVTPVGFDKGDVTEFLFVPYLGACIHVPPPPANQIVFVKDAKNLKMEQMYQPIWLTGKLEAIPVSTALANVGYSMIGPKIKPYKQ